MGLLKSLRRMFDAGRAAPPDATKLDAATEAALAQSLSSLAPEERGWITFAEAGALFSSKGAQYAFGQTDQEGNRRIASFASEHASSVHFMPVEGRVYFVRDPPALPSI
jgi:hypothetical protein